MLGSIQCAGVCMSDELFRTPVEVLRRELEYYRARLKRERAEAAGFEERLKRERSEGLALLVGRVLADVERTSALVSDYKRAIKVLKGG